MEETNNSFLVKVGDFVKKYAWALAIGSALLAIAFLFLPILKYEVREAVYEIGTDERIAKADYLYGANLVWYLSNGIKFSYTMVITICLIGIGIVLILLKKFNKDLMTLAGIMFLLAVCMFILSKEFFKGNEDYINEHLKIVGAEYDSSTQYFYA